MKKGYKKDFQSWKGIVTLKLLCCNIAAGRFDWKKYCTPQPYCGQEICVIPLHCSYGQIGYTVYFPYSDMPEVEYDWEMNKLTIDKEIWENYLQIWHGIFIPNGRTQSLQMQEPMFQKNTAVFKQLWYVRFPSTQQPLAQK